MGKQKTIAEIREKIEISGYSAVPFSTVEYVLGITHDDDDTFETAVSDLVDTTAWVTGYGMDWINTFVLFTGPQILEEH